MGSDHIFRPGRLDGDPPPARIPGAGSLKHDKGARVFAAVAIFLFACYLVGAVSAVAP
jgi:hypothetical protein